MKIRKISGKNLESVMRLGAEEFKGEEWFTKKFVRNTLMNSNGIFIGAFEKNKLVGCIFVEILDKPKSWIFFFVVKKEFRRRGIGTKLLKHAESHLSADYDMILVDLEKVDKSGLKFYKKNNFRKVAKITHWFGNRHPGLIYMKEVKK